MARRSSTTKPADETTAPEATDESAATTPTEATDEGTTEAPAETTEKVAEKPVDLEPFKVATAEAMEKADPSTGDLPKDAIDSVNKVYREIDGVKGKNQARTFLDEEMKRHIMPPLKDIMKARAFVSLKDGLSAGSGSGAPKAPADPTLAFVQKVVALRLALDETIANVPEGVGDEWTEKADALTVELAGDLDNYREYTKSDDADAEAPEVSPVVRQVFKLAAGRGSTGGSGRVAGGPRRDIEKHMIQVFDSLDEGAFLTINDIAKTASTEYGDDRPSAGAVSARLFPKGRDAYHANGIKATNEDGKVRGATKVAV